MNVQELSREQLISLKQNYICHVLNKDTGTSWGELADANEIVTDETVFDYYKDIDFVDDDFFCSSSVE